MIVIILHEGAHAITAVSMGMPTTLFNCWVDYDSSGPSAAQRATSGAAGPVASLVFGLACWLLYWRAKNSRPGLPFLYLASSGIGNFFGNLMSAAFVGDFSNAALVLGLSQTVRYAASLIGAIGIVVVL